MEVQAALREALEVAVAALGDLLQPVGNVRRLQGVDVGHVHAEVRPHAGAQEEGADHVDPRRLGEPEGLQGLRREPKPERPCSKKRVSVTTNSLAWAGTKTLVLWFPFGFGYRIKIKRP